MNGDDVFVVIFCVACDVIGGTDCLISSSLSLSLSLSIALALSLDFDTYLCALYMQPYVDQMWRSRWPLGCRPKRLKTIAAHCQIACSVGGNLACNSATLIRFWVSDSLPPFPHPFPGCASTTFEWRLTVKEAVARRTRMENAKWLKDAQRNRTKMSPSRGGREREKVKKAFAK